MVAIEQKLNCYYKACTPGKDPASMPLYELSSPISFYPKPNIWKAGSRGDGPVVYHLLP